MLRSIWFKLALVAAILVAGAFVGLHYLQPIAPVMAAKRGTMVYAVAGNVSVRPERQYVVVSDIPGRILTSSLELNARVAKGDVLVRLDSTAAELEIQQLKSDLEAARKRRELGSPRQFELEGAMERQKYLEQLLLNNAVPPAEVDAQKRVVRGVEHLIELERVELDQRIGTLETSLAQRETLLDKMTLRSPIDGVVSRVYAEAGDLVGSGTPIAEVLSINRIVEAKVSQDSFNLIKLDQKATVRLLAYPGQSFPGKVVLRLPAADLETQLYTIHLEVDAGSTDLAAGLTGETLITVDEHPNALLIPPAALMGDNVFVLEGNRVRVRKVRLGYASLRQAEILEGLDEGDEVVVGSQNLFRDGDRARRELVTAPPL